MQQQKKSYFHYKSFIKASRLLIFGTYILFNILSNCALKNFSIEINFICFYCFMYRKSGWLWTPGWLWTCYRNNVMSITLVYLFSFSKIFLNVLIGQCMNIMNNYEFLTYFVTVHAFCAFFWRTQKTRYWNSGQTFGSQPEQKNKISISGVV